MALFASNIITSDSALGSASIQRSLRFNRSDNAKLSKTFSSAGNRRKWTFSVWAKFPDPYDSNTNQIFSYQQGHVNHRGSFYKGSSGVLNYQLRVGGSRKAFVTTAARLRDPNSWYHIVLVIDSDQGSSSDRVKIYLNGVYQSDVVYHDTPTSGFDTWINSTQTIYLGAAADENGGNMYLAECNFIDGSALTPSSFGFTDPVTGIWMPKRYEGTYGTNGFYLDFSDNSSTAALGIDKSPNGNDWTTSNFSVSAGSGNDSLEDTPTNNFPILNPITTFGSTRPTVSNGGLDFSMTSNNMYPMSSFMIPKTGKWYAEVVFTAGGDGQETVIVSNPRLQQDSSGSSATHRHNAINYYNTDIRVDDSDVQTSLTAVGLNNVIGICVDRDAGTVFFKNNNVQVGTPVNLSAAAGSTEDLIFGVGRGSSSGSTISGSFNFGQRPFAYTPPAGFRSVCARNILPDSSIVKPQKHFDVLTWTGNGSTGQNITGLNFKPDLLWIKKRNASESWGAYDSIRGVNKRFYLNESHAEQSETTMSAFNKDGFRVEGSGGGATNDNNDTYVGFCWKAGGASVSNTDGSVTTTVSANPEAGFSIVDYNGGGNGSTMGHGLGAVPHWILIKKRDSDSPGGARSWAVFHRSLPTDRPLRLDDNTSQLTEANFFREDLMSTTVFGVNGDYDTGYSGDDYVAYCWTEIPGYSKFGRFTGNGNSDGVFIYLGFRARWFMWKRADSSTGWGIIDTARDIHNDANEKQLGPDDADADGSYAVLDINSNGIKMRNSYSDTNASGGNFVYFAFAEQPNATPFDTFPNAR